MQIAKRLTPLFGSRDLNTCITQCINLKIKRLLRLSNENSVTENVSNRLEIMLKSMSRILQ